MIDTRFKHKFADLIAKYPELDVIFMINTNDINDDYNTNAILASENHTLCNLEDLILYNDQWLNRDDAIEMLSDDVCDEPDFENLDDDEFYEAIENMLDEKYPSKKYIVIYV